MNAANAPVVVGVGISPTHVTAVTHALREAERRGVELRVVHATGMPAHGLDLYVDPATLDQMRATGQAVLDRVEDFIDARGSDASVSYVLHSSGVVDALMLEATDAGVLVVGADDVPWPERLLGGAVATHLVRHAASPVVVVPERTTTTPLFGGVVVAIDRHSAVDAPLQFAFEQASLHGVELHAMYIAGAGISRVDSARAQANLGEVLSGRSERFPEVSVLRYFALDSSKEACRRATERAELLVLGRSRQHGLPIARTRGVELKVLRHSWCPVAVVPVDYRGA